VDCRLFCHGDETRCIARFTLMSGRISVSSWVLIRTHLYIGTACSSFKPANRSGHLSCASSVRIHKAVLQGTKESRAPRGRKVLTNALSLSEAETRGPSIESICTAAICLLSCISHSLMLFFVSLCGLPTHRWDLQPLWVRLLRWAIRTHS